MGTFSRSRYGKMIARAVGRIPTSRRPRTRLALGNLEDRVVPASPAAPSGFTATTTSFNNNTQVLIDGASVNTVTSQITVSGVDPYLFDVDLSTTLLHTYTSDLFVTLTSPAGTSVTITSENALGLANVYNGTLFDDQADPGSTNGATDFAYTNNTTATPLTPEEPLGAFIGEDPNGTWTLTIHDTFAADGGSLDAWSLDVTTLDNAAVATPPTTFSNNTPVAIDDINPVTVTSDITVSGMDTYLGSLTAAFAITHTYNSDLVVTLTSPAGTVVTLTSNNGLNLPDVFNGVVFDDTADPGNVAPYTPADSLLVTDTAYVASQTRPLMAPEQALAAFIGEDPNGTWTLTVADQFAADGGELSGWSLDLREVAPAGTPSVTASAPDVTASGATPQVITVVLADDTAIDTLSVINNNIAITIVSPDLSESFATYATISNASPGTPRTATFEWLPGDGTFDGDDNGTYLIVLEDNQFFDEDGNAAYGGTLGSFDVAIQVNAVVSNADDSGVGSLRAAIEAANASPTDDTITFDPVFFATAQTIALTSPLPALPAAGGGLSITGPGANLLTVDAGGTGRVFDSAAPTLVLSGMTVTGGAVTGEEGAGIRITNGFAILDTLNITGNTASGTGTLYFNDGGGGGLAMGNFGGNPAFVIVRDTTIAGNTASSGGGMIYLANGNFVIERSTISGNTSSTSATQYQGYIGGGGVFICNAPAGTPPTPDFDPFAFTVRNSTIANNSTTESGGGIGSFRIGGLLIQSSTITGNTAGSTGGGTYYGYGGGGISAPKGNYGGLTIQNSIVSGNNNDAAPDINTTSPYFGDFEIFSSGSLIGSATGHAEGDGAGNLPYGTDPMLSPLQNNGGPTLTMTPLDGSPLIDAGNDALVPPGVTTDQRGEARFNGTVDIGSVEFVVPPFGVAVNQGAGQADPVTTGPITFDIQFNEEIDPTTFDLNDVSIGGTFAGLYTVDLIADDLDSYRLVIDTLEAGQQGTFVVTIAAGGVESADGDMNTASVSTDNTVTVDLAPTVVVAPVTTPTNGDAVFSVTFSENVTGFDETDVFLVTGGSLVGTPTVVVTGGPAAYTVTVSGMTGIGTIGIFLSAGAAEDANNNPSEASNSDAVVEVDTVAPTVAVTPIGSDPTYGNSVSFAVLFDEAVTGFDSADITVGGTAVGGTASVTGSGATYTVTVSGFTAGGTVQVVFPGGAATDLAGNPNAAPTGDNSTTLVLSGAVQFSAPTYTVTEEGLVATITVNRVGGTEGALAVNYTTVAGTAVAGSDYTTATGTLTFPAGSAVSQDIVVTILNDQVDEADESFTVVLSGVTVDGTAVSGALGSPSTATVTITGLEPPAIFLDAAAFEVVEGGASNQILVRRVGDNTVAASADYAITFAGSASAADFNAGTVFTGTVSFAAGSSTAQPILLPLLNDTLNEGNETFTVTLSNFTGTPAGTPVSAVGTIARSDGAASKVAVTDVDGDTVTVVGSKGTTLLTYIDDPDGNGQGPIEFIDVTASTAKSNVAIKVKTPKGGTGNGLVELMGLDAGALKGVAGAKARLTGDLTATGAVKSLVFAEVADGSITAGSVGKIITKGFKKKGVVVSTGDFEGTVDLNGPGVGKKALVLGALTVKGSVVDSTFDIGGNVGKVKAVGFTGSTMTVGDVVATVPFDSFATIDSFTVTGTTNAFADSDVLAGTIKKVSLRSANTGNGGVPFGFTVDTALNSLKLGKPVTFTYTSKVDGLVNGGDKSTGDFTVDVV